MAREQTPTYAFSLQAGTQVTISIEVSLVEGKGSFFKTGKVNIKGEEKTLINGFVVEFDSIGLLITSGEKGNHSVIYQHKKSKENRIYYYADDGDILVVNIVSIPIHNHSSIVQGGPAFGTYHSDYEE